MKLYSFTGENDEPTRAGNCLVITLGFSLVMFTAMFESSLLECLLVDDVGIYSMNTVEKMADAMLKNNMQLSPEGDG
jgi:hypothetical protein